MLHARFPLIFAHPVIVTIYLLVHNVYQLHLLVNLINTMTLIHKLVKHVMCLDVTSALVQAHAVSRAQVTVLHVHHHQVHALPARLITHLLVHNVYQLNLRVGLTNTMTLIHKLVRHVMCLDVTSALVQAHANNNALVTALHVHLQPTPALPARVITILLAHNVFQLHLLVSSTSTTTLIHKPVRPATYLDATNVLIQAHVVSYVQITVPPVLYLQVIVHLAKVITI